MLCSATALLVACSFDYSDGGAFPQEITALLPETELTDVSRTIVRDGRVVVEIRARHMRNFRHDARTELEEVRYIEYDSRGTAVTTGSAKRTVYYNERKDAVLAGAVRLRSESQGVSLEAEGLRWEDERRLLISGRETVQISRDDGSLVAGAGLEVDVRSKTVRFSQPVSGILVTEAAGEDDP